MDPTRATFVLLAEDLITTILSYQQLEWIRPERDLPEFLHKFRPELAYATIIFANRHRDEFDKKVTECGETVWDDRGAFVRCIYKLGDDIFKGNVLLMEFITFCAFIAFLVTNAHLRQKSECIDYVAETMADVFEEKVQPFFPIIGGWPSLYEMATQYITFMQQPVKQNSDEDDKARKENT